jgi:hypothetical protein
MISRVLAVLAAFWLVLAFALATVIPPFTSCSELLADMDHESLVALSDWGESSLPNWLWDHGIVPVMLRPAWLVPTGLGLVLMGLAITIGSGKGVARSHRRRS